MTAEAETVSPPTAAVTASFEAKVRAELAAADLIAPGSDCVSTAGDLFAEVMLVKGDPGPAEHAGGAALSGPDGQAARKALTALGFDPESVFATLARPESGIDRELLVSRLRLQIEAVDPFAVIALDSVGGSVLADAFGVARLAFGRSVTVGGRVLLAVDGLEASLAEESSKRRAWRQLKSIKPRGPSY